MCSAAEGTLYINGGSSTREPKGPEEPSATAVDMIGFGQAPEPAIKFADTPTARSEDDMIAYLQARLRALEPEALARLPMVKAARRL
jgi:hypothetical protein